MDQIRVRLAKREDCEDIRRLRIELAAHSNMLGRTMVTVEDLQRDGFDVEFPYFKCLLAETTNPNDTQIVGYALYYYSYAAFEGKSMHLEDLCVSKNYRSKGIGSILMKGLGKICIEENLARMSLEALDWNKTAINFYEKHGGYNSTKADKWVAYCIEGEALLNLAK